MTKNKTAQPVNAIALANHISGMTAELVTVKADVELLKRLKGAEANAERLEAAIAEARTQLATAETNDDEIKRQEAFARIRNMSITAIAPGDNPNPSLLQTRFAVTYETVSYDSNTRRTVWLVASAPNINHLPIEALAYLTEATPEIIPASIMALAPDSPAQAVGSFIQAIRRGYMTQ